LAFVVDPLLLVACWKATNGWEQANREYAFWAQFIFMFGFTKVVKLVGLFVRYPSDFLFLPVSIVFGYFHGFIKLYALFTLKMVWIPFPSSSWPGIYLLLDRPLGVAGLMAMSITTSVSRNARSAA
jgi:hypothetical protein